MPDADRYAAEIADLMFQLLTGCQQKEERISAQLGITAPEFRCLRHFRGQKKLLVKDIVDRMEVSASRLSRILEGLEKKGYLKRTIAPDDRRSIVVSLTPKGTTFVAKLEEKFVGIHREILASTPPETQATLTSGLKNLLASLERWLRQG